MKRRNNIFKKKQYISLQFFLSGKFTVVIYNKHSKLINFITYFDFDNEF